MSYSVQQIVEIKINPQNYTLRGLNIPANLCEIVPRGVVELGKFQLTIGQEQISAKQIGGIMFTLVNGQTLLMSISYADKWISFVFENPKSTMPRYTPSRNDVVFEIQFRPVREMRTNCLPVQYFVQNNLFIANDQQMERIEFERSMSEDYKALKNAMSMRGSVITFYPNGTFDIRSRIAVLSGEVVSFRGKYQRDTNLQPPQQPAQQLVQQIQPAQGVPLQRPPGLTGELRFLQQQQAQRQTQQRGQQNQFELQGIKTANAVPAFIDVDATSEPAKSSTISNDSKKMEEEPQKDQEQSKVPEKQDVPKSVEKVEEQPKKIQSFDLSEENDKNANDNEDDSATVDTPYW